MAKFELQTYYMANDHSPESLTLFLKACSKDARIALNAYGQPKGDCEWPDYRNAMIKASISFKKCLFALDIFMDNGDCYREYYRDGKYQSTTGRIIFPSFNPDEMMALEPEKLEIAA